MSCRVCGEPDTSHCSSCKLVSELVTFYEPGSLLLIVDGSIDTQNSVGKKRAYAAGAGLVLARAVDEVVIAVCAAEFDAKNNNEAEFQAIVRGLRWAPGLVAWSDSTCAVAKAVSNKLNAQFIPDELRDPLHHLSHRLANAARQRDHARLERIWIPGEVW